MFGARQAASMDASGGYPTQLTDEPEGARAVRFVPGPPKFLMVTVLRQGHRRLLLVEEEKAVQTEVDAAPGDQIWGGFSRDGKRFFYVVQNEGKALLKEMALDTRRSVTIQPPPPAAGIAPPKDSVPLEEALKDLQTLGPLSPDSRTLLAIAKWGDKQALYGIDITSARANLLTPEPGHFAAPQFLPDSRTLYLMTDAGRQKMGVDSLVVPTRQRKAIFEPQYGELSSFALSPDGHKLVLATESGGETLFSLVDLPSLRPMPLAAPPSGALGWSDPGEPPMIWDRAGEKIYFAWRLADDTTDVWTLRTNYGTPLRITRSPRPGLPRDQIVRPQLVKLKDGRAGWLWKPESGRPRLAVLVSTQLAQPVFDKRIAALNFAGVAVLAVSGAGAQKAALDWLNTNVDLDSHEPLLLDFEGLTVDDRAEWSGIVGARGSHDAGLSLDTDVPDIHALVRYATRTPGTN